MTVNLLDISVDEYHADSVATVPTLNSTVAKALILETPAHAKQKHPKLAEAWEPKHTDAMDEGTALHQMLLGDDRCDILDYDSFRSTEAQVARDTSRIKGRVPILRHKWDQIAILGESLKQQVASFPIDPPLFVDGFAEQTIVWNEGDVMCRARIDWLRSDFRCIDDLKKSRTAQPRRFHKQLWSLGYHIQAAFYVRGCRAAFGVEPSFRWVAIEPEPPYALSVHVLSQDALEFAQTKVDEAIELWAACLADGVWPAYPLAVQTVELPPWLQPQEWDDSALMEVPY